MKTSLRQLGYVVSAARHGSISGAAQAENISTSSILAAIDAFEEEFGIQVFVRQRSKGLSTTAAGHRAMARTIRLLDETAAFSEELRGSDTRLERELHVGAFTSISPSIAPQVIRDLRVAHPGLTVHLNEGDIMSIQNRLRDGRVDVLLTYDAGLYEDFVAEPLVKAPPHVVLAATDPLAAKDVISLRDLTNHPLLLLNLPQSRNYVLSLFERHAVSPGPIQRLESFEMVRSAAAAGLGVALLNIRPPSDVTYSGLKVVCRPLAESDPSPSIVLATRSGGRISRRSQAFVESCRAFFATPAAQALFVGS
ncbi:MAG: LysR substrate-binding domain-containing protein [Marivita sp.]|uniref:LysR substrate-binding domain-containing protein n=1 Tax=Marivita sp. TaxID=2003365 RepID=UPI0025C685D3|nr:LysR substrate-binding domain-containing protein [Marivita sp.]MCI5112146.1 LysR substrate-binding domain-containing protein [Marivita sp.]